MGIKVSVVVPTYKRPEMLDRCLQALVQQDLDPSQYEIVVADDACSPETKKQVEGWNKNIPCICYVPNIGSRHGPAAARNAGWRNAAGKIIAFTDVDCIPSPSWLRYGVAAFKGEVRGAAGPLVVPLPKYPTDYELNAAGLAGIQFVTANCFYLRKELEAVHGFDETFELAWREDTDLFFTFLERLGGDSKFVHVQEAIVIHPIRPAQWGISLKQQRKSMYNALLYKKHPRLYRDIIQRTPPWQYYWVLLILVGFVLSLGLGFDTIALSCALAWLALTFWLAQKRLKHTTHAPTHVIEMLLTSALIPMLSVFWRLAGAIRFHVFFL